jgi:hypothetical protein
MLTGQRKLKCIGCYELWSSRSHEHGGRCCTDRHAELDLMQFSQSTRVMQSGSRFPPPSDFSLIALAS